VVLADEAKADAERAEERLADETMPRCSEFPSRSRTTSTTRAR